MGMNPIGAVAKVIINGETVIDATVTTANDEDVRVGKLFLDKQGKSTEGVNAFVAGDELIIDAELSNTSTNPVQNKIITEKIEEIEEYMETMALDIQDINQVVEDHTINKQDRLTFADTIEADNTGVVTSKVVYNAIQQAIIDSWEVSV